MKAFLERNQTAIVGVLSGFDRIRFGGSFPCMNYLKGFDKFLGAMGVLYKDFGKFAEGVSDRIKAHARKFAERYGREVVYLESSSICKEETALRIAERDKITQGLVCVLSCVEPCATYSVRKNPKTKHLELISATRKCLFLYFYFLDREFGLMHVRLQTWLPMRIQICLNGREYLARRLARAGIDYEQRDNCFARIDDLPRAQQMLDDLEQRDWVGFLDAFARRLNPWVSGPQAFDLRGYYWTIQESEYATDVMFKDRQALARIYPALVQYSLEHFSCRDVLRFLGRGGNGRFQGPASGNLKYRPEGVRVKYWVDENSIKMYDKQDCVLRVETTINNPRRFKVRRVVTRNGRRISAWVPMRKNVADLLRRVEVSRAANERYFEALGVVGDSSPTRTLTDPVSRRIIRDGRPYRALRPIDPEEAKIFSLLLDGKFLIQGFRNRDLREQLISRPPKTVEERRRVSARISRMLRLLRAHSVIRKVSTTSYYRVTSYGQQLMTAALRLRDLNVHALAA
jgi:hypothetical protein